MAILKWFCEWVFPLAPGKNNCGSCIKVKKKRNKNFFSPHFCLEVYGDIFRCNRSCWEFGEASMVAICHKTLKSAISVYLFPFFFLLILTTFFPIFKNFPWILSFTFLSNSDCTSGTFQILFKTLTQFKTASVTSHDLMSTNLPWKTRPSEMKVSP